MYHLRNAFSFDKKLVIFKNKAKYTLYYNSLVYNWIGGNAEVSHLQKVAFTQQYASLFHKICGIFACPKRNSLLLKTEQFEVCLGKDAINWRKFWKFFNGNFCFQSLNLFYLLFKIDLSQPLFIYFCLVKKQLTAYNCSIKNAGDWIRTQFVLNRKATAMPTVLQPLLDVLSLFPTFLLSRVLSIKILI